MGEIRKRLLTPLFLALLCIFTATRVSYAQLTVQEKVNETLLVSKVLLGEGMEYRNVNYTGYDRSIALFENGFASGLGIDKGVVLSSGIAVGAKGPNDSESYTSGNGGSGVKVLDDISTAKTMDAAMLEFEFKPQTSKVQFRYVFSSEEYLEWVNRGFNDVFGFFVSGPGIVGEQNVALVPGTTEVVSIDNINDRKNSEFYIDNRDENNFRHKWLQHDGQTVILKANIAVQACEWYKIKLAIADVGDPDKDSWVFLEARSFQDDTELDDDTAMCNNDFVRTLYAGHPDKQVRWFNGDTSHSIQVTGYGTYWVEIFTDCGSFKDEVTFYPAISPISLGEDSTLCGKVAGPLIGVANRTFETYLWSDGSTAQQFQVPGPGLYSLTVTRGGCPASDTIEYVEVQIPEFVLGPDSLFCGDIVWTLNAPAGMDEYLWSDNSDGNSLDVDRTGTYWLQVERSGCRFRDSVSVEQRNDFDFDIGPELIEYCFMRPTDLITGLGPSGGYQFLWSTGATTSSIVVNDPGIYSVEVSDTTCDFIHSDEILISAVGEGGNYWVPNAFTPTGDALNEQFSPIREFEDVLEYEFCVFNRWGEKVFFTMNPNERWDGTFDGEDVASGTYFWYCRIKTTCLNDSDYYRDGTVELLR